jgi:hypothetical protein
MVRVAKPEPPQIATRPDLAVVRLAARQNEVVSVHKLHACGLNSSAITVRVRRGQLCRVRRGVYAVGSGALTLRGTFTAAVLACGDDAILAYYAAAAWHAMRPWSPRSIDVIVQGGAGRAIEGIRAHRTRSLDPFDVWRRDSILVTSPARTALDLATDMTPLALRRMVRQSFAEGILSVRQLTDVLGRSPRHRGAAKLRALLADGYVPTRSELEDRGLDVLASAGIARPEVNVGLAFAERRIHPDLFWRDARVVVELDGSRWHDDTLTRADDADKQAILEAAGLRVLRVSWRQLVDHPQQTAARVVVALGLRP